MALAAAPAMPIAATCAADAIPSICCETSGLTSDSRAPSIVLEAVLAR